MAKDDESAPDKVTHDTEFVIGHKITQDVTVVHKDDNTYTGHGWSRDEADRNAGEKYSRGEVDKK